MRWLLIFSLSVVSSFAGASKKEIKHEPLQKTGIRVVPVSKTPEPDNVSLRLSYPEYDQVLDRGSKVNINFRLRGFALGTDSDSFERASQIRNSKEGQTIHVIIDDEPYFEYAGPSVNPFHQQGDYYQENYRFNLPSSLSDGMHVIRLFACRSYGESLKRPGAFEAVQFFVKERKVNRAMNINMPFLTYNEPTGSYQEGGPILLDFLISNCELSKDGYTVRLFIDDQQMMDIDEWKPYYLYGLDKGKHTIRLQLLDSMKRIIPGLFNDVSETIQVR